jgi:hypothetical protein
VKSQCAGVHVAATGRQTRDRRRVIQLHGFTVGVTHDEKTGLFEEFTKARDVVRESTAFEGESARRLRVTQSEGETVGRGAAVSIVDAASGKDVRAADEIAVEVATEHKNFVTIAASRTVITVAAGRGLKISAIVKTTQRRPCNRPRCPFH